MNASFISNSPMNKHIILEISNKLLV